jgi:osmotically inducible protein OsmC
MALTFFLGNNGQQPKRIDTTAVCTVEPVEGGFKISKMTLQVSGEVPGLTQEQFAAYATQAEGVCPVSNALRNNLEITLEAKLT